MINFEMYEILIYSEQMKGLAIVSVRHRKTQAEFTAIVDMENKQIWAAEPNTEYYLVEAFNTNC